MTEFKDQLDATEKDKVTKLVSELRELAEKAKVGDASVTADTVREKISETQQASLGLFQKVGNLVELQFVPDSFGFYRYTRNVLLRMPLLSNLPSLRRRRRIKLLCFTIIV